MAASKPIQDAPESLEAEEDALLDAADAGEEIPQNEDEDEDHPMDSDPDEPLDEIQLQNDSIAHFDSHKDSIFCIAQHPTDPSIVATGGGDDTTFLWSYDPTSSSLPTSNSLRERPSLQSLAKITGHTDSINALTFTQPDGTYLLTGGLDGQIRAHLTTSPSYQLVSSAQEVPEINFLAPCPAPSYPDTFALGASDGSVWVYTISSTHENGSEAELQVLQAYYLHTASCTAAAWTPDGNLLATVAEDGTFYVWDPFGAAAAQGVTGKSGGQTIVSLTPEDARFAVEGGLYSIAIAPSGAFAVVGGAGGNIRVVGLPRLGVEGASSAQGERKGAKGGGAKDKAGGGKRSGGPASGSDGATGQVGQILASFQAQGDSVETLAFSEPPLTLLAAGSVDGSVVLFDYAHMWAVRRQIKEAHDGFAAVKVEFLPQRTGLGHVLTSCGMDGVVRRWDVRGGTAAGGQGLIGEWKGHRGDGEGGGVLGFVQGGNGKTAITAGDDAVSLVFDMAA
ncbi:uncharacterized protein KY384_000567 [Bacidia gigantensis]|uniref:uncharacterized protein n=1 Tax=Bacidia gigantensis TaxID=2732470 RepID=UPI001D04B16B|nr:uncharacterized protein KY384_000567 [Bacidia gigantensis]KAG8525807.1 hypothetical protein KY384_000567 [Bacidia gigantensis]